LLTICRAHLSADDLAELLADAGAAAAEMSGRFTDATWLHDTGAWRRFGESQVLQHVWALLAQACPDLFGTAAEEQDALALATAYSLRYDVAPPAPLILTGREQEQADSAAAAVEGWTGLRLPSDVPLVVSWQSVALRAAIEQLTGGREACALKATTLPSRILMTDDLVARCRERAGEVSELALLVLHERLHVALTDAAACADPDPWQMLAGEVEEAVVTCLELAGEWWLWTDQAPTHADLYERARWHGYRAASQALLRATPASDPLPRLTALALSVMRDDDDNSATQALNELAQRRWSRRRWTQALSIGVHAQD
jgi:hypothetical protein